MRTRNPVRPGSRDPFRLTFGRRNGYQDRIERHDPTAAECFGSPIFPTGGTASHAGRAGGEDGKIMLLRAVQWLEASMVLAKITV